MEKNLREARKIINYLTIHFFPLFLMCLWPLIFLLFLHDHEMHVWILCLSITEIKETLITGEITIDPIVRRNQLLSIEVWGKHLQSTS